MVGELDNFKKQMFYFFPFFRPSVMRASAAISKPKLPGLAVCCTKHHKGIITPYSTAYYFDITKLLFYGSFTKYLAIFQKKHFKKRVTQYFLAENKSPCFLELSQQNLLQLNMSKI